MDRKKKVFWNQEEEDKVVGEAITLSRVDESNLTVLFKKAQNNVLPPERRKHILSTTNIKTSAIEKFRAKRNEVLVSTPEIVTVEVDKEVLIEKPRQEILDSISREELWMLLGKLVLPLIESVPLLVQRVGITQRQATMPTRPQFPTPPAAPVPIRKVRVLMVGFKADQKEQISRDTSNFDVELTFEDFNSLLRGKNPACNWCIHTRFSGHKHTDHLEDYQENGRLFRVSGTCEAKKALAKINSLVGSGVR